MGLRSASHEIDFLELTVSRSEDHAHVEMEVDKWHHNGDFFYKKVSGWEPPRTFTPPSSLVVLGPINLSSDFDSSDEELKTLEDLAAKQKREKK